MGKEQQPRRCGKAEGSALVLSEMIRACRYGEVLSLLISFRMVLRASPSMPQAPFCRGAQLTDPGRV